MIGIPQKTIAQANGGASRSPRSEIAPTRAEQAAGADRGGQVADLRRSPVEHLVGGDDDQHVQAAANERLRGDQADEQPRARDLADGLEALPDLGSSSARARRDAPLDRRSAPASAAETRRAAAAATKTTSTLANATSTPAASGPTRVPRLSIVEVAPFAAISSRAVRASDGSSAIERRPEQRRADTDHRPGDEDDDSLVHAEPRSRRRRAPPHPAARGRGGSARGGTDRRGTRRTARSRPPGAAAAGRRRRRPWSHRGRTRTRRGRRSAPTPPTSTRPRPAGRGGCPTFRAAT